MPKSKKEIALLEQKEKSENEKMQNALKKDFSLANFVDISKEIFYAIEPTPLMHRFANEYVLDYDYEEAAKRCGISPWQAASIGLKLLNNEMVQNIISNIQLSITQKLQISKERILQEYFNIATANPQDLYDENGELIPIIKLKRNVASNINKIKMKTRKVKNDDGEDEIEILDGEISYTATKDKLVALEKLAQHIGMDKGGTNISITLNQLVQQLQLPPEAQEALRKKLSEKMSGR